jgi:UDPglucose 6-dehydrogenase
VHGDSEGTGAQDVKIAVYGNGHLATITASCLATLGHDVSQWPAPDVSYLSDLCRDEPGFSRLRVPTVADRPNAAIAWVCDDTPVKQETAIDVDAMRRRFTELIPRIDQETALISSVQMPVGTMQWIESEVRRVRLSSTIQVAYIPENLRHGQAVSRFLQADRWVVGSRVVPFGNFAILLASLQAPVLAMSPESAEMTKHAINAYLGLSTAFANEIAATCDAVGANAMDVYRGLTTDARVGTKLPLKPGGPFAGGTLARDLTYLGAIRVDRQRQILDAVLPSNRQRQQDIDTVKTCA